MVVHQEASMNELAVMAAVAAFIFVVVLMEIAAAALPLIIVITLVPPGERAELADLLAACDSSRRLRLWTALHAAVAARRLRRRRDTDLDSSPDSSVLSTGRRSANS
jgi:hypothetical protein